MTPNRRRFLASCGSLAAVALVGPYPAFAQEGAFVPAVADLSSNSSGRRIIEAFLGLSFPPDALAGGSLTGGNSDLIRYVRGLGRGLLRVTARTTGRTLTQDDYAGLHAFARAVDWPVLLGLDMGAPPDGNAEQAYWAAQALGDRLFAFELADMPDERFPAYGAYLQAFRAQVHSIGANVPTAHFAGPSTAVHDGWTSALAHDERAQLVLLTEQYRHTGPDEPQLGAMLQAIRIAGRQNDLPFRIDRVSSTGANETASVLWTVEFCFRVAAAGSDGVNFTDAATGAPNAQYSGLQLFGRSVGARLVDVRLQTANPLLGVYAVERDDGSRLVTIINRHPATGAAVTLDNGGIPVTARVQRLTSLGLHSERFALTGWMPQEGLHLDVPAAQAALVEMRP